jgi:hypothetical protein
LALDNGAQLVIRAYEEQNEPKTCYFRGEVCRSEKSQRRPCLMRLLLQEYGDLTRQNIRFQTLQNWRLTTPGTASQRKVSVAAKTSKKPRRHY